MRLKKTQMIHWEVKLATYVYNHWNICNISIYFCNIHMKRLQYTCETSETLENTPATCVFHPSFVRRRTERGTACAQGWRHDLAADSCANACLGPCQRRALLLSAWPHTAVGAWATVGERGGLARRIQELNDLFVAASNNICWAEGGRNRSGQPPVETLGLFLPTPPLVAVGTLRSCQSDRKAGSSVVLSWCRASRSRELSALSSP
jgi:hypothetical protein